MAVATRSSRLTACLAQRQPFAIRSGHWTDAKRFRSTTTGPPFRKYDVDILEVGPRDGLQNIKAKVETSVKVELIKRLAAAGCSAIEATSFVSPKWIPQLADSNEVMKAVLPMAKEMGIRLPVLTPNLKGFERAVQNDAQEAVVFASASEGFSWKNTNCSVEDALVRAEEVVAAALKEGIRARG